jgi:hypothetical protein
MEQQKENVKPGFETAEQNKEKNPIQNEKKPGMGQNEPRGVNPGQSTEQGKNTGRGLNEKEQQEGSSEKRKIA